MSGTRLRAAMPRFLGGRVDDVSLALGGILALALALRLIGIKHGLPFSYNADEATHFVPKAVRFFEDGDYNPHYNRNPPAYTYVVHLVLALWFRGGDAHAAALGDPGTVYVLARATSALLGTVAVGLVYLLGARLLDRGVGLLAAGLMAVAFLPVFYSHLALNDVPMLVPLTLSLLGSAAVLRRGRLRDYALAGGALGLAVATKYTAGYALGFLLAAAAVQVRASRRPGPVAAGLLLGGVAFVALFFLANPYFFLDLESVLDQLREQARAAGRHKVGLGEGSGHAYYAWSFTWGLGWLPGLAAAAGALYLLRDRLAVAVLLLPAPALYLLYMGGQERYFGRWLLPLFPVACLLAAYGTLRLARAAGGRRSWAPQLVTAAAVVALLAQALVMSGHSALLLSRSDTRNLTRAWMIEHVPAGSEIVLEPVVPVRQWLREPGRVRGPGRWVRNEEVLRVEGYPLALRPELVDRYEAAGACWVVTGSTMRGRAFAEPYRVPNAIAYYYELEERGEIAFRAAPWSRRRIPLPFNFDWSFDYYPLAYERPGAEMIVYRLRGGACSDGIR